MAMKRDWWSCDGGGSGPRPHDVAGPASPVALTRRGLLVTTGLATVGWLSQRTALAQVALQPGSARAQGDVLVTIFLRGGLDGLKDRLGALGGTLWVHTDPCAEHPHATGSTLRAIIPPDREAT